VAHQVTDPVAADAFRRALRHWADGANDQVISISPGTVTGFRLVVDAAPSECSLGDANER
jgi:hypothetical protein